MITTFLALFALVVSAHAEAEFRVFHLAADPTFCMVQDPEGSPQLVLFECDNPKLTRQGRTWMLPGQESVGQEMKCLTANGIANGALVEVLGCDKDKNRTQSWSIDQKAISLVDTDQCLDNQNGTIKNGNPIQTSKCVPGNTRQQWLLTTVSE